MVVLALACWPAGVPAVRAAPGAEAGDGRPGFAFTVLDGGLEGPVVIGSVHEVELLLSNDGSETWSAGSGDSAASHWLDSSGAPVAWEGPRTTIEGPVAPGQQVRVALRVHAPDRPGVYGLQWDVVREGVCWISQRDPTPPAILQIDVVPVPVERPEHAFSMLELDLPLWLVAGTETEVPLSVRNDGALTWEPGGEINLSYHWLDAGGTELIRDGLRTPLDARVEPGGVVGLAMRVLAPEHTGRLRLQVDMVHEQVCWFSQQDPDPEPPRAVWVLEGIDGGCLLALLLSLALVMTLWISARRGVPDPVRGALSLVDLVWASGSILLVQGAVLREAGLAASPGRLWASGSIVALLLLASLLVPRRARPAVVWALTAGVTALVLADLVYLRYFGDVISLASIGAAGQTDRLWASIAALLKARDLVLVAPLLVGLVVVWQLRHLTHLKDRTGRRPVLVAAGVLALLVVPGVVTAVRMATAFDGLVVQVFQNTQVVSELGLLGYHARDAAVFAADKLVRPPLSAERYEGLVEWFREREPQRSGHGPAFGAARGANLVMVQMESAQDFILGLEINGQEVTPFLNRMTRESLWYSRCFDQAAQGRSSDAELITQSSLLPPVRGTAAFRFGANDFVGLAEVLAEHGYHTLSAVPFDSTFWNRRVTHPAYGFRRSLFADEMQPGEIIGWGLNDRDFLAQMVPQLEQLEQPFAALLITLSLHHPFEGFPERHKVLELGRLEGTRVGEYLHVMHFADAALAGLVRGLDERGLLDHTVLAVWGDHGAGFAWTPELAELIGRRFIEPEFFLADQVPLLIRVPQAPELSGEHPVTAGHADIAPTLLALLGIDPASLPMMGRNLLGTPGPGPVVCRYGTWVDDEHLYVNTGLELGDGRCYPLATLEQVDPAACARGVEIARRQLEVASRVLTYDLQQRLRTSLETRQPVAGASSEGAARPEPDVDDVDDAGR